MYAKKPYKKSKKYPKKNTVRTVARRVTALKREVEGDKKFWDVPFSTFYQTTSATVTAISQPRSVSVGSGAIQSNTYSSYYYLAKSMFVRASWFSSPTGSTFENANCRMIIFQDKEVATSPTAPTATDLLASPNDPNSPLNILNCKRFHILRDKHFMVGNSPSVKAFNMWIKIPTKTARLGLQYNQSGSTYTPRENQIYILFLSDQVTNVPEVTAYTRLRYIDT
jgi:hypothetical protein